MRGVNGNISIDFESNGATSNLPVSAFGRSRPPLGASGRGGLASLLERHEQLLPDVRRALRPQGVTQLQSFYLGAQPTRPALCLSMLVPDTTDVKEMICDAARTDRSVREWEQLLSAVYDAGAVRNAAWYELFEHELNAGEVLRISSGE